MPPGRLQVVGRLKRGAGRKHCWASRARVILRAALRLSGGGWDAIRSRCNCESVAGQNLMDARIRLARLLDSLRGTHGPEARCRSSRRLLSRRRSCGLCHPRGGHVETGRLPRQARFASNRRQGSTPVVREALLRAGERSVQRREESMGNSDRMLVSHAGNLIRRGGVTRKVTRTRDLLENPIPIWRIEHSRQPYEFWCSNRLGTFRWPGLRFFLEHPCRRDGP